MYFLIGLGVIVVLVYGNMLYDHIKEKKKADEQTDMTEKMQTKQGMHRQSLSKRRIRSQKMAQIKRQFAIFQARH